MMTTRDRRALRFGAGIILGAVILLRLVPWGIRAVTHEMAELDGRRALLSRTIEDLNMLSHMEDSADALTKAVVALAPRLLSGHGDGEALAELQGRLSYLAATSHVRLNRVDPVGDSTAAGNLRRVTVDAVFEGDVRGLRSLLVALTSDVLVTVPLRIRVVSVDPTAGPRIPEALRLEMRIGAWALRPKPES